MRYPKRAYTFSVDYFSTPESVDPIFFNINRIDMITHWFCFFDQWLYPYWPDPALPLTIQVAGGFQ
ncbi:hypothetical protein FAM18121_01588 [Lacticaseibacillus paracasei]|nr:hypothetical protein FAM18121_01588 [Lacticaseibacillus paracasei]